MSGKHHWINIQARILNTLPQMVRRPVNNLRILPKYIDWYTKEEGRKHAIKILEPLHM